MPRSTGPRLCKVAGRDAWHIYDERSRISTGCTDRREAESVLARYLEERRKPQATAGIRSILDGYVDNRRSAKIPGLDRIEWAVRPLHKFFGEKPAEVVTQAECRRYADMRQREGVSASTARTELQALRAALRWAVASQIIPVSPIMWLPARPPPRDRWLTRDEADRLLEGASAFHVRLFIVVGLHTAARKEAILGLPWSRVDLDRRRIDFRDPAKAATRKRRPIVPINETLYQALADAKIRATTEWVIEWGGDRVISIKRGFREAAIRAGLEGVTPHVLRHTAATWMAQAGLPLWQVAGMLGNTEQMVQDTYGHHHPDYLKAAANALG